MRALPLSHILIRGIYLIHICFAALLVIQPACARKKNRLKPLIITTIAPSSPRVTSTTRPKTPARAASTAQGTAPVKKQMTAPVKKQMTAPVKKQMTAPVKKQTPLPAAKAPIAQGKEPACASKTIAPTKKNLPPQPASARGRLSDQLLKELEESLSKIEGSPEKVPQSRALSPLTLTIDSETADPGTQEENLMESIIAHLYRSLTLPERGAVKIQLRLRQDGSVIKLTVLSSESSVNKQYLETHLPLLRFPRWGEISMGKKEHELVITFVNEI